MFCQDVPQLWEVEEVQRLFGAKLDPTTAKLDPTAAFGAPGGLSNRSPRPTWTPHGSPNWPPRATWTPKCLPSALQVLSKCSPSAFRGFPTLQKPLKSAILSSKIKVRALLLLKCSRTACGHLSGSSWTAFWSNLEPLGRLLGPT